MTTGGLPSADDFARRRLARHDRTRRRFAVAAVVLVVVGALAVGLLVAYALSGDPGPERDADGRLVPPSDLVLDDAAARDLVATGTWPGETEVEGMPTADGERLRWLLSDVAWDDEQAAAVGQGLRDAAQGDADLVDALVSGVAGASRPLLPAVRADVADTLGAWPEAVAASLAGEPAPEGQPAFEQGGLLATVGAIGPDDVAGLEQPLEAQMSAGWESAFPAARRDAPGAVRRFSRGFAEQFRRSAQPVVLLHVGLAGPVCGDEVDEECRAEVTRWTARADELFAAAVLDSIPRDLLPPAVRRGLGDDGADGADDRDLPPAAQPAWERFRQRQGYGITGPVLDALAS